MKKTFIYGYPGGYYAEVSGGEPGNLYTAQVLATPPNMANFLNIWNWGAGAVAGIEGTISGLVGFFTGQEYATSVDLMPNLCTEIRKMIKLKPK